MPDTRDTDAEDDFPVAPPIGDTVAVPDGVERMRQAIDSNVTCNSPPKTGEQLADYVLKEKLGAGAMGTVFRGESVKTGNQVAVKILDAEFVRGKDALQRFRKEAKLLSQADSPFITRLIEVGETDQRHFIVTELIDGPNVGALLAERRVLSESLAVGIAAEVAAALHDISALKIIHRDIKPENILLATTGKNASSEFRAMLTDFGLARHTEQSQSLAMTRRHAVMGTPMYMSPEQFADASQVDTRTDIYSLGVTLFHMLTGQPPFIGKDLLQLAEEHRHTPAPDLRSINNKVSGAVSEVVRKCLQKRPELRYATASELLADLQRLQQGEAIGLSVHPQIPNCKRKNLQTFRFEWDLVSTPARLWPFVSNTERLNRAIGLPAVDYTTSTDSDGTVQTFANVRIAGIPMRWHEHVFEWIEDHRMGVLREFEFGPIKWFTSAVELIPTVNGHTRLVHTLQAEGRNWLGSQFIKFKMGFESKRSLAKVYKRIDGVLKQTKGLDPMVDAFETAPKLKAGQRSRLDELIQQLRSTGIDGDVLLNVTEFIRTAPPQEAGRIRPLALAQQFNVTPESVVEVLLRGTQAGLFELVWDVICPSCRIATQVYDILQIIDEHEHCESCNLQFEVDFRNQIEAVFRVHPQIRRVDTGKYCIGGPVHAPHVVAQTRVAAHETVTLELSLMTGSFCIRGPQLAHSLWFSVHGETMMDDANAVSLSVNLARESDWNRSDISLRGGYQIVTIHNDFDREIVVRVERGTQRVDALTAEKLLAIPLFRELFPTQTFAKSQLAALTHVTLLQTAMAPMESTYKKYGEPIGQQLLQQQLQNLNAHCTQHGGTWVKIVDGGALMAFHDCDDAARCARSIEKTVPDLDGQPAWPIHCAMSQGEVTVCVISGQLDYIGPPVDALRLKLARP